MNSSIQFDSLLVPVDFSPVCESAFGRALTLARGKNPVLILLHVIDPSLVEFAATHGWGSKEEVAQQMQERAEQELQDYRERADSRFEIETIVSQGVPFLEILRKAEDFSVDAIVIGKIGRRGTIEQLLFGSTAEKVLRGSRRPVIILPTEE
jgi:glycine betaine transporter